MKTKEAIEFVEWAKDVFSIWNELEGPNIEFFKQGNEVVKLLQRGEKYETMWKECQQYFGEDLVKNPVVIKMETLEQNMDKRTLIDELKVIFKRRYGYYETDKYNDFIKQINKMTIKELNNAIANMTH